MKTLVRRSALLTALLVIAAICTAPRAVAANLGIVHGTVHEDDGKPVPNAKVSLFSRGERAIDEHLTGADGHFEFEQIPFGQYRLEVLAPDGRRDTRLVRVASGEVLTLEISLPALFGEEIVVTPPTPTAPAPPKTTSSSSHLDREEIRALPRGDSNTVNELLATQPGFVYDALGNLFARGNHANIQYQIDGVPLPDSVSGLFGGFLSPKFIENMELITGGLNAEYGERLATVVNLNSRRPTESGEGEAELTYGSFQTVSPSLLYGRQFGSLSLFGGASFRRTDRALDPPAISPILHDRGDEERAFLRLNYDVGDRDHFSSLTNFSRNFYQIPIDPTLKPFDPAQPNGGRTPDGFGNPPPPFFPADTNSTETEWDFFQLLSYRHDFINKSSIRISGSYRHTYAFLFGDAIHALGPTQDACTTDETGMTSCAMASDVRRRSDNVGFNAEYLLRIDENNVLKFGGRVTQLFGTTDFTSYTRSDSLRGVDPSQTVAGTDRARATTGGVFAQDSVTLGKLTINAGLRFDFQTVLFVNSPERTTATGIGPRIGVAYAFTENVVAHAFGGLLWMPPPVLDTPAAARILGVIPPGQAVQYDLRPEKDRYAEVGINARVIPQLALKLTVWGKLSTDQLDDIGIGNTNLLSPYNFRDGRAGGIEAGATAVVRRWLSAFGNVSFGTAQGRGIASAKYLFSPEDVANNSWQLLDHTQIWTANGGISVHDGPTQVSLLANYGSGLRTGPRNNQHVPDHVRVDVTLAHRFISVPGTPTLAFDIINLFDAHYPYRIANGFNASHWAPERSAYVRLTTNF